jgi:hypothetical protein
MYTYTFKAARLSPGIFNDLFTLIPSTQWDVRLDPERFTPREVICHLADWEPIFCERITAAVKEDMTPMPDLDEGQFAIDHDYAHANVEEQLRLFADRRERTLRLIESLTPEQLQHRYDHASVGPVSIAQLANTLSQHDLYHVEQLLKYLTPKVAGTW